MLAPLVMLGALLHHPAEIANGLLPRPVIRQSLQELLEIEGKGRIVIGPIPALACLLGLDLAEAWGRISQQLRHVALVQPINLIERGDYYLRRRNAHGADALRLGRQRVFLAMYQEDVSRYRQAPLDPMLHRSVRSAWPE